MHLHKNYLMKDNWIVIVLVLVSVVMAEWSEPVVISNLSANAEFPQMYIDPRSKVTHTLWIEDYNSQFRLAYRQIYSNKSMSAIKYLETSRRPRLAHIVGSGDGHSVYIAYDAKRVQGDNNDCNKTDRSGCYEIFFTNSRDSGNTWSKPIMIEHKERNDIMDRKGPRVIYLPYNKQIFLTYWRSSVMCYASRIGDFGPFSQEKEYTFSNTTAYQSIVYTFEPTTNSPIFHFFFVNWTGYEEHIMYTRSMDLGRTWSPAKGIWHFQHSSESESFMRPFVVANHEIEPEFIAIGLSYKNKGYLIWSTDNGGNWSEGLYMNENTARVVAPRIQICRNVNGKVNRVYALYGVMDKNNNYVFGSMDIKEFKFKQEPQPFKGTNFNWDYMIDCYRDEDAVVVAAIAESDHEDIGRIYLSYKRAETK
jgi:hypothetical protein